MTYKRKYNPALNLTVSRLEKNVLSWLEPAGCGFSRVMAAKTTTQTSRNAKLATASWPSTTQEPQK